MGKYFFQIFFSYTEVGGVKWASLDNGDGKEFPVYALVNQLN